MKKTFIISMLVASVSVFGTSSFPSERHAQQEKAWKIEVAKDSLDQSVLNMSFDDALKKGEKFAEEYLYAWGASISFTRQDRDANLRVLCEKIGSFLLITALKQENYKIVDFLKDHGADMDKVLCCITPLNVGIK